MTWRLPSGASSITATETAHDETSPRVARTSTLIRISLRISITRGGGTGSLGSHRPIVTPTYVADLSDASSYSTSTQLCADRSIIITSAITPTPAMHAPTTHHSRPDERRRWDSPVLCAAVSRATASATTEC